MELIISQLVRACDTNTEGEIVLTAIERALISQRYIKLDFSGINCATSSFVNSSFVPLLKTVGYDAVKKRISVVGANKQIARIIRDRMDFESNRILAS